MQREQQVVLDILLDNIRGDYAEASGDRRALPRQAVDNASAESLRAFIEIHEGLSRLVGPSHIRTRYTHGTATGGYGVSYYRDPIITQATNRANREIQAICLPTKPKWRGVLEVYFSGHAQAPVESADIEIVDRREGLPVYCVRNAPTPQFVSQTIEAFGRSSILS
jgi:hypothetical protein